VTSAGEHEPNMDDRDSALGAVYLRCADGGVSAVAYACYETFAPASPAVCVQGTVPDRPLTQSGN
jgi:hypothetical protein